MSPNDAHARALSAPQIQQFIQDGYVRLDHAFPQAVAAEARQLLWKETGCDPDDPSTWTRPVIRLGWFTAPPFVAAANTSVLHAAFNQLAGEGRWSPVGALGTFPVRFPSPDNPGDAGWHIDVSFGTDLTDFSKWRANITSRGRALLLLYLFSDVEENDAPTRIRVGSHLDIARQLAPAGEAGLTLGELGATGFSESQHCREVLATGTAGTVYLCHPFLVHAAQPHRGKNPRFLAQPPLPPREPFLLKRDDGDYSPVEQAIRLGLAMP